MSLSKKTCSACGNEKSADAFPPDRNMCKTCKYKTAAKRKEAKTANISGSQLKMLELFKTGASLVAQDMSLLEKCKKTESLLMELSKMNTLIMKGNGFVLSIPIHVPEIVHDYLVQVDGRDPLVGVACIREAKRHLNDRNDVWFKKIFGIDPIELRKNYETMTDMELVTSFVRIVYQLLVEEDAAIKYSMSNLIEEPRRPQFLIRFDAHTNSIVADDNPLQLDQNEFMRRLDVLLCEKHAILMMNYHNGLYDKFKTYMIRTVDSD